MTTKKGRAGPGMGPAGGKPRESYVPPPPAHTHMKPRRQPTPDS